jgi:RluA family pseudouridine synthase
MNPTICKVRRSEGDTPLVEFIAKRLSVTKRSAKALLDRRNVTVNGKLVWMARHPVSIGDEIRILSLPNTNKQKSPISVLFRDSDIVVVNKPSGLLSCGNNSIESALQRQLKNPGLRAVHRLDRDTSGCLMVALSEDARSHMVEVFRAKLVAKVYHAIVFDHMPRGTQRISKPLAGQTAISNVRVLHSGRLASHVSVNIETGRTHQIRIHLASIRHPVLGDRKYAGAAQLEGELANVARQMLHAYALSFPHPNTGKPVHIKAPLPADFKACLKSFKLT